MATPKGKGGVFVVGSPFPWSFLSCNRGQREEASTHTTNIAFLYPSTLSRKYSSPYNMYQSITYTKKTPTEKENTLQLLNPFLCTGESDQTPATEQQG